MISKFIQADIMQNCEDIVKGEGEPMAHKSSAADRLRRAIVANITPILSESDGIKDSNRRLLIQASCLDALVGLEDVIKDFNLEECRGALNRKV